MEDLQAALQKVLSDPGQMEQIFAMANALGLAPPDPGGQPANPLSPEKGSSEGGNAEQAGENAQAIDPALLRLIGGLGDALGPEIRVLNALRPVLSDPGKVDRALRAARLSRLAGQLLRRGPEHV